MIEEASFVDKTRWQEGYEQGRVDWPFRSWRDYPADLPPFPTVDWCDGHFAAQHELDIGGGPRKNG